MARTRLAVRAKGEVPRPVGKVMAAAQLKAAKAAKASAKAARVLAKKKAAEAKANKKASLENLKNIRKTFRAL